jgi:predicted membrane protein
MILAGYCVGGAALGAWLLVRFPSLGPKRYMSTVLTVLGIGLGMVVARATFAAVAGTGRYGLLLGLVLVVFPTLTIAFWLSACVLRALADGQGLRR